MNQVLTKEDKKYIYDLLADQFIQALSTIKLGRYEQKIIARKILREIEKAQSWQEVINFLENLSQTYLFFKTASVILKNKIEQHKEKQIIEKLESFFKNYHSYQN
jgi:hypothetical protein